jgi:hypothetical protein
MRALGNPGNIDRKAVVTATGMPGARPQIAVPIVRR